MARMVLVFFLALVFPLCPLAAGNGNNQSKSSMSFAEIVKGLDEKSGRELFDFICALKPEPGQVSFTDTQLDTLIARLQVIERNDGYQREGVIKAASKDGNGPHFFYANRWAANNAIFVFKFQKIVNGMRRLPMPERVDAIIAGMDKPWNLNFDTQYLFGQELARCGKDAVPCIILHKPKLIEPRRRIVKALHDIHDPRGVDYIIDCLQSDRNTSGSGLLHESAAGALEGFQGEKVLNALTEALRDPSVLTIDRNEPQMHRPGHQAFRARYFHVRHAAAQSLTANTGHDWGLLFNEDAVTWRAWLDAKDRNGFNPAQVKRSQADLKNLISALFDRFMSGRPNPWQPQNDLEGPTGVASIGKDLAALGQDVLPLIEGEAHARIAADPIWSDFLNYWTKKILNSLPWPEAHRSAEYFQYPSPMRLPYTAGKYLP